MINAKFMYREFTPRGVMPSDVTALQFFGEEEMTAPLTALKSLVQYDRLRLSDYEIGVINSIRNNAGQAINDVQEQKFINRIEELEEENLYTPKVLADKFSSLLQSLGFVRGDVKVNEYGVAKADYSSSMPNDELLKKVEIMMADLQEKLEARKRDVLVKYGLAEPTMTAEETTSYSNAQGEDTLSGAVEGVSSIDNGLDFEEDGM